VFRAYWRLSKDKLKTEVCLSPDWLDLQIAAVWSWVCK
jgi:hypothetical protein